MPVANLAVTFVGEVPQGTLQRAVPGNNFMAYLASMIPQALPLGETNMPGTLQFPAQPGDIVWIWDVTVQDWKAPYEYLDGYGWISDNPDDPGPAGPVIGIGQGFRVQCTGPDRIWTQHLHVSGGGNRAPVLAAVSDQVIPEGTVLTFTNSATDPDFPTNTLTFSLGPGAPGGAIIDPTSGVFTWTPGEAEGPGVYPIIVRVADDGVPPLSDAQRFTVVVNESNAPPLLDAINSLTNNEGVLITFIAAATDPDIPTNQLRFSLDLGAPAGAAIDPTNGVFTWTPSAAQSPGTYPMTVRVTDDGVPPRSDAKTFTVVVNEVHFPPLILVQPQSQTNVAGGIVSFNVDAEGTQPLSYQWWFSGTGALADATNDTLTLSSIRSGQAGSYWVIVANDYGSATSAVATLTVLVPPVITRQPLPVTVDERQTAILTMAASNEPLEYQWQRDGVNLTNDVRIGGATSNVLTIRNAQVADAGTYAVVVRNADGVVLSDGVPLVVQAPDLAATALGVPSQGVAGQDVQVTWMVANLGPGTARAPWIETLLLATDPQGSDARLWVSNTFDSDLRPGQTATRTVNVTLPADLFGPLHLLVCMDSA